MPEKIVRHCGLCRKEFSVSPSRVTRGRSRYCSKRCAYDSRESGDESARFWSKVDKDGPVPAHAPEHGPCWVWTAARMESGGYGAFRVTTGKRQSKLVRAHRYSLEESGVVIEVGLQACHKCDNPACIRPAHLFLGTDADNSADKVRKGRQSRGPSHVAAMLPHVPRGDRHPHRIHPELRRRGEKNGGAKLTDERVIAMRVRYRAKPPISQSALAKLNNVSQSLVHLIVNNLRWKHLLEVG